MTIPATISPTRREVTSTGPGLLCSVDHEPIIRPRYCLHNNPKNLIMILHDINKFDVFKSQIYVVCKRLTPTYSTSTQEHSFLLAIVSFLLSRAINKNCKEKKKEKLSIDRGVITHFCCIYT